jgi:hypothetical protein
MFCKTKYNQTYECVAKTGETFIIKVGRKNVINKKEYLFQRIVCEINENGVKSVAMLYYEEFRPYSCDPVFKYKIHCENSLEPIELSAIRPDYSRQNSAMLVMKNAADA